MSNSKDLKSDILKTVALGGGVALATAGLTTCDFGAVDPAPPPLDCKADMGGIKVSANGTVNGQLLTINVRHNEVFGSWKSVNVTGVQGASLDAVDVTSSPDTAILRFVLPGSDGGAPDGGASATGSFTFEGVLSGSRNESCMVKRTFNFSIAGSFVTVARLAPLPLETPHAAAIALVMRQDDEVILQARTRLTGERRISWSVTAGEISADNNDVLRWRLPREPGLYQVELVVEHGEDGLAFDTLTFEVA